MYEAARLRKRDGVLHADSQNVFVTEHFLQWAGEHVELYALAVSTGNRALQNRGHQIPKAPTRPYRNPSVALALNVSSTTRPILTPCPSLRQHLDDNPQWMLCARLFVASLPA